MPQPLLEALDVLLRASSEPIILHYDTVFNMGNYYLSTLIFRHAMFKKNPIVPIGFLIHSRRFHEDHLNFLKVIQQSIASKRIIIVTDREFNFSEIFPLGCHVFVGTTWNETSIII